MFYETERVLFVSLHQSPLYPGTGAPHEIGASVGEGYNVNVAMPPHAGPAAYGKAFRRIVLPILDAFAADVVLVSAGLDAHARDPLAQLELDAECFGAMATALVQHVDSIGHGRIAMFLEGGYDLDAIEESMDAIGRALRGEAFKLDSGALRPAEEQALLQTMRAVENHWLV
jgi:acetoin utilization deacetylase AcuC-like enzyme